MASSFISLELQRVQKQYTFSVTSEVFNMDCMEGMKQYPDKYFELAIVDPPYFNGPQKPGYYAGTKQRCEVGEYKDLNESWDIPEQPYFDELIRVSENQIIWGINYFNTSMPGGRIVWVKGIQGSPFSMADIAYQSFYNRIDLFKYTWSGFWQEAGKTREHRIHPTQKPVALYKWLLQNYAKPGDKILDTHLGSGSSRIAAYDMGFDFTGFEIDKDYFEAQEKRFNDFKKQLTLFPVAAVDKQQQ
ncbi:MAG TPA: DNA methyltransferase [Sphingobacteriaceae bacterium]